MIKIINGFSLIGHLWYVRQGRLLNHIVVNEVYVIDGRMGLRIVDRMVMINGSQGWYLTWIALELLADLMVLTKYFLKESFLIILTIISYPDRIELGNWACRISQLAHTGHTILNWALAFLYFFPHDFSLYLLLYLPFLLVSVRYVVFVKRGRSVKVLFLLQFMIILLSTYYAYHGLVPLELDFISLVEDLCLDAMESSFGWTLWCQRRLCQLVTSYCGIQGFKLFWWGWHNHFPINIWQNLLPWSLLAVELPIHSLERARRRKHSWVDLRQLGINTHRNSGCVPESRPWIVFRCHTHRLDVFQTIVDFVGCFRCRAISQKLKFSVSLMRGIVIWVVELLPDWWVWGAGLSVTSLNIDFTIWGRFCGLILLASTYEEFFAPFHLFILFLLKFLLHFFV